MRVAHLIFNSRRILCQTLAADLDTLRFIFSSHTGAGFAFLPKGRPWLIHWAWTPAGRRSLSDKAEGPPSITHTPPAAGQIHTQLERKRHNGAKSSSSRGVNFLILSLGRKFPSAMRARERASAHMRQREWDSLGAGSRQKTREVSYCVISGMRSLADGRQAGEKNSAWLNRWPQPESLSICVMSTPWPKNSTGRDQIFVQSAEGGD